MVNASVRQGTWAPDMPYLCLGSGAPLLFLPGLTPHHRVPAGAELRFQIRQLVPYARHRQVWWVNRGRGLRPDVTMADLAGDLGAALRLKFDGPVDVLGVSTGGSLALQLAADHPDVVRRLVVVSAAHRLGLAGREAQRRVAREIRDGRPRAAAGAIMGMLGTGPLSKPVLGALGRMAGERIYGDAEPDMVAVIDAEDEFHLRDRLAGITAPTLVVGGARDAFYGAERFRETADGIPGAKLVLYPRRGHIGPQFSRHLVPGVLEFLGDGGPARERAESRYRPLRPASAADPGTADG